MKLLTFSHYQADPFYNMAFDEWMLQKVCKEHSLVLLRRYSWKVGTITFGFNQQLAKAYDHTQIGKTPVIRRVTGGRGLYHDVSELTYSVAISSDLIEEKKVSQSISKAAAEIAKILVRFLDCLQIKSDYVKQFNPIEQKQDFFHKAPCFESFSRNEIVANDQKIIASAQRRLNGSMMQHGSMKINGLVPHPALPIMDAKHLLVNEIKNLDKDSFENAKGYFFNTFSDAFGVECEGYELTENEYLELENRIQLVTQNSLEKREFFKQSASSGSL